MIASTPENVTELVDQLDLHIASKYPVPEIGPLLEDSVLAGGKRLRPSLALLMSGVFGLDLERALPFARVAEFIHGASLAHDDVLDMATMRRDKPTINALSNNSKAVLSGDFLVARAMAELSDLGAHELLRDISEVMEHLVYGEWLQEESRRQVDVTAERLLQIAEFKTASLIAWCCMVPARIRKADETLVRLCQRLGLALGVAFQIVDDVIDYDLHGQKEYARDVKNGFMNFVTWELLQKNPHLAPEVQAFLNGDAKIDEKWQSAEIAAAKMRVRDRAADELARAKATLIEILEKVQGANWKSNGCANYLIEMIDAMSERKI